MRRALPGLVLMAAMLPAGDKNFPAGRIENGTFVITAAVLPADEVKQEFGPTLANQYTVLDVRVMPRDGKQVGVHLDDFLLRSESSGDHSGPLVAEQIAGDGTLVISRTYAPRSSPEMPPMLDNTRVQMRKGGGQETMLEALKKRILAERTVTDQESGLLFFPLQKEKPKNLVLYYTVGQDKLRTQFK